ncbi:hypothetical protein PINS_up009359 [Pythium insidiosum]|nr:hypothetical protein PINS_up009359 [Pythium insidiosum]
MAQEAAVAPRSMEWLLQFARDASNDATPLGAFVAALPAPVKRRAMSSSERGKAFRARQRQYELELESALVALRSEITTLELRQRARDSMRIVAFSGSALAKIVVEYHDLFKFGLPEHPDSWVSGQKRPLITSETEHHIRQQEEFISRVMHPNAVVGAAVGPDASIRQWRLYTAAHHQMHATVLRTHVSGTPGDLTVVTHCTLRVRFSRNTICMLFPHVLHDEALVQRLVGREVEYHSVKHFHFTPDGQIDRETVDVSFVEGLVRAGLAVSDVMRLLSAAAITSDSMIEPKDGATRPPVKTSSVSDRDADSPRSSASQDQPSETSESSSTRSRSGCRLVDLLSADVDDDDDEEGRK